LFVAGAIGCRRVGNSSHRKKLFNLVISVGLIVPAQMLKVGFVAHLEADNLKGYIVLLTLNKRSYSLLLTNGAYA
jgi:hypothetical protein